MADATHRPFAELLATPGVAEEVVLRSTFGFMAYHGGSLEEMTDVIAAAAAERCGASLYTVRQPPDLNWHIPSHKVAPDESPALARFLEHVDVVVTVHGFGRRGLFTSLLLGGRHRELAEHVGAALRCALPAYEIVTELERIPSDLRGMHATNPVNLPRRQGVQIELPPRVRGSTPMWADWEGPGLTPHTEALVDALASAAAGWDTATVAASTT
ncbi:MAG: hypothetical protein JWM12_3310 [Ilumatobacteraceae bacterium]|nr:hypothetical protein [Ilumatobacteraceae bacterium]